MVLIPFSMGAVDETEASHKTRLGRLKNGAKKLKAASAREFYRFADWLEAHVDKKLNRFYVTREEHEELKRLYANELELARQRIALANAEREALVNSTLESRRVVEELSENARKLLELNSQLKELLKEAVEKKAASASGSEVVIRSMRKIKKDFGEKLPKKKKK